MLRMSPLQEGHAVAKEGPVPWEGHAAVWLPELVGDSNRPPGGSSCSSSGHSGVGSDTWSSHIKRIALRIYSALHDSVKHMVSMLRMSP
jgi:hypothetical protein